MSDEPGEPSRRSGTGGLDYGPLIGRSLGIVETEWRALLVLAVPLVGLPSLFLADTLFAADVARQRLTAGIAPSSLFMMTAQMLLVAAVRPVVLRRARMPDAGPVPIREAVSDGLATVRTTLAVAVVTGLPIGIGYKLFWLPGLAASVLWFVAVPAAARRHLGVGDAMEASARLTRGHRWDLVGLMVVVWLFTAAVAWLSGAIFGIVGATGLGRALATIGIASFLAVLVNLVHEALAPPPADPATG